VDFIKLILNQTIENQYIKICFYKLKSGYRIKRIIKKPKDLL